MLLNRPRIDALLENSVRKCNLITVIAGVGFGKTTAVSSFSGGLKNAAKLSLSHRDRSVNHFWQHLTQETECAKNSLPPVYSTGALTELLEARMNKTKRFILILDNFNIVKNSETGSVIKELIQACYENLCIIAVSDSPTDIGFHCIKNGGSLLQVTQDELCFTAEETARLFEIQGISIPKTIFDRLNNYVQGWAMALDIFAAHLKRNPYPEWQGVYPDMSLVECILEQEYYSAYSQDIRTLITMLSLLDSFPFNMAQHISRLAPDPLRETFESNYMLRYDFMTCRYVFMNIYREFLNKKALASSAEERVSFLARAGDWFYQNGCVADAAACYFESGAFGRMLDAIMANPAAFNTTGLEDALLGWLERLPEDFTAGNPGALYIKAVILLSKMRIEPAYRILRRIELRLGGTGRADGLLGEVNIAMALIDYRRYDTAAFLSHLRAAAGLLPNGSSIKLMGKCFIYDSLIYIKNNRPGELEVNEKAMIQAAPYINYLLNGSHAGIEHLFSAEKAYCTFDLHTAKIHVNQALAKAKRFNCADIISSARFMMARIALLTGKTDELMAQTRLLHAEIPEEAAKRLYIPLDGIECLFRMATGSKEYTPGTDACPPEPMMDRWGPSQCMYAVYLMNTERYYKLLAFLKHAEDACLANGFWMGRLYVHIFMAGCYAKLKDAESSAGALWKAYDMSHRHGIITPFIEFGGYSRLALDNARRNEKYIFDPEWLHTVYTKCCSHIKRMNVMRLNSAKKPAHNVLSRLELKILASMSQGLTRNEIADFHGISKHTARSYIKSIYSKLGAANAAEAVNIAHMLKLL